MVLTDEALVRKCLSGDDSAYGFLVDKYKGAVHTLARKKLGNYHDAEEVAQEAFLKAYQNLPSLKSPARFAGWLYVIASNECRLRLRAREKEETSLRSIAETERRREESVEPINAALHTAIEALPESDQTVIHLHHFGGLSCEEISRFIGASKDAVKMRLSRARARLKKEMIAMLDQKVGFISLPMEFTMRIMAQIERLRFLSPAKARPNFVERLIPVGAFVVAALVIGLGLFSTHTAVPPTSWEGWKEVAIPIELLNWPMAGRSLTVGAQVQESGTPVDAAEETNLLPEQNGKGSTGLAALVGDAEDENSHISGVVVSKQSGQPISGAVVTLRLRRPEGMEVTESVTDASGHFQLNIRADIQRKAIGISANGYGFHFVQLPYGQRVAKGLRIEMEPGVSVRGSVVDADGNPVAKAKVEFIVGISYGRAWVGETQTDANGDYTSSGLNPRLSYKIYVFHPELGRAGYGFVPAFRGETVPVLTLKPDPSALTPVTLDSNPAEEQPATGATVQGFIRSEDGAPVAGVTVRYGRTGNTDALAVLTETDSKGYYRADNVQQGQIHLLIKAEGFSPFHERFDTSAGGIFEKDVTLTHSPVLVGKIVDDLTGNPIPHMQVVLPYWEHLKDGQPGPPDMVVLTVFAETDAEGNFTFNQIPVEGGFPINVLPGRGYHRFRDDYVFRPTLQRFFNSSTGWLAFREFDKWHRTLEPPVVYRLKRTAHVRVQVEDAATGNPITGFYVSFQRVPSGGFDPSWLQDTELSGSYIYAEDGLFVSPELPEGAEVTLVFRADGYVTALVEGAVAGVNPNTIHLRLEPEQALRGSVVDADTGEPIENAWVKTFSPMYPLRFWNGEPGQMGQSGVSAFSDTDGQFALHQLGKGRTSFFVSHPDYAPTVILEREIGVNGSSPLAIKLSQGGTVTGTAIPGKLVAAAYASHIDDNEEPQGNRPYFEYIRVTTADAQGQFRFERLAAGRHYLAITNDDNPRLELQKYMREETVYPEKKVHVVEVQEGAVTRRDLP